MYNLLARNAYVVRDADALYAVGWLRADAVVEGGTGWACALYLTQPRHGLLYLFDMDQNAWMEWDDGSNRWTRVINPPSPTTFATWAGVESRDVTARITAAGSRIILQWRRAASRRPMRTVTCINGPPSRSSPSFTVRVPTEHATRGRRGATGTSGERGPSGTAPEGVV